VKRSAIGLSFGAVVMLAVPLVEVHGQSTPPTNPVPRVQGDSVSTTASVAGFVQTALNTLIPGATVRIVHIPSGRSWVSWTDDGGKFSFPDLPVGPYRVEAKQLGFGSSQIEMNFSDGKAFEVQLTLHVDISPTTAELKSKTEAAGSLVRPSPVPKKRALDKAPEESTSTETTKAVKTAARAGAASSGPGKSKKGKRTESLSAAGAAPGNDVSATLDEAPSSEALSMNGTVNRASTLGGPGSFGRTAGFTGGGSGGADFSATGDAFPIPGQNGAAVTNPKAAKQQNGALAKTKKKVKQPVSDSDPTDFGQGIDELYSQNRISRVSANQMHLSIADRFSDGVWNARPYALTGTTPAKLPTYDNIFNLRTGGPLSIPHVFDGRQRTFFFFSTEIDRGTQPLDAFTSVPTAAERTGDFSDRGVLLYDPMSSQIGPRALLGTSIPQNRMDKAALGLLPYIPLPNLPGFTDNYHLQDQLRRSISVVSLRVLHAISTRLNVSAGYSASVTNLDNPYNFPGVTNTTSALGQSITLSLNQNWTTRMSNSTKVNWTRNGNNTLGAFAYKSNLVGALGIQGVSQAQVDWGLPPVHFTNFSELHDLPPSLQKNQTLRVMDNLSYAFVKHTVHAGTEIRWMQINADANQTPRGEFEFTGLMTSQLGANGFPVDGTGFDFADFLLGLPQNSTVGYGLGSLYTHFRSRAYVFYGQDDWRVRPRFAINYGLRYELVTPPVELDNRLSDIVLNPGITQVAVVQPGQVNPFTGQIMPRALVKTNKNNWGPRIGIAWRPPSKLPLVFRAGYGIFYNESVYNQLASSIAIQPPFANTQILQTSTAKVLTLENSFSQQPSSNVTNTVAIDPNYRVGYAQLWNISLESQVTPSLVIDVNYNGTKGTHLDLLRAPNRASPGSPLSTDLNRRVPNARGFVYDSSEAYSLYQGIQLIARRQTSHGLIVQGNYTYGHAIDDASSINNVGSVVVVQDDNNLAAERGRSAFDIRHQFGATFSYDLPFGPSKRWLHSGWLSDLSRDLKIIGQATIATGTPFTARVLGSAADNTGTGVNLSQRADQIGDPALPASRRTPLHFFNTDSFALPLPGQFGNAARNTITGPGVRTFDYAISRKFKFGQDARRQVEWRWELSNAFNTPNFIGLNTVINSSGFGEVQGVKNMRRMDMYLKVSF
jgi:hypothetical protein